VCLLSQAQLTVPCEFKVKDAWVPGVLWADKENSRLCWGETAGGERAGTILIGSIKEELGMAKVSPDGQRLIWNHTVRLWEERARNKAWTGESMIMGAAKGEKGVKHIDQASVRIIVNYVASNKTATFDVRQKDMIKKEMRVAYKDRNDLLMLVGGIPEKIAGDTPKGKP